MKIVSVVGARPQFIKAAPVSEAFVKVGYDEFLVHTGQHYDHSMSQVFFDELGIPKPRVNLNVGSGRHGWQTGEMLARIEEILLAEKPDWILVYGDTNSTLAGALAAVKLHIPLAHIEAGLRSFNRQMPEEHNRVLTDHCADLLLCPTQTAVDNLAMEGITSGVHLVGDTMYDAVLQFTQIAQQRSTILHELALQRGGYLLATVHRPYNTDDPHSLEAIIMAFREIGEPVIFPIHPRTRQKLIDFDLLDYGTQDPNLQIIEPVSYLDMLLLEQNARLVLTDLGGMQKEAFFSGVPCITLRPETEWVETVAAGWNHLVGADSDKIIAAVRETKKPASAPPAIFGDGCTGERIAEILQA